jgi:anti-sigma factor RsiW
MLNHPEPRDLLAADVDNALDPATQKAIAAHLETCPTCRADVEGQRQVKRFLAPTAPLAPAVPAHLAERVRGRAYAAATPPRRAWAIPRPALSLRRGWLAAGALAMLVLLAGLGLSLLQTPSPAAAAAAMSIHDHAMCEQAGGVPAGVPGDAAQVSSQLTLMMKHPIDMPAVMPPGYHFAGGHEVTLGPTLGAHMAWMQDKQMLSLYQAPDPGGAPPQGWRAIALDGRTYWIGAGSAGPESAVFWRQNGMILLLVGALPEARLLDVAGSVGAH